MEEEINKGGQPRNVADSNAMSELWKQYKEKLEEKAAKWEKIQYVGKDGDRVIDNPKIPLTLEGFKVFCWDTGTGTVEQYFTNQDKLYGEYIGICSRIKNEIRADQIEGGMMGFYNPSITQRLNNLKEQTESITSANIKLLNIDPLGSHDE